MLLLFNSKTKFNISRQENTEKCTHKRLKKGKKRGEEAAPKAKEAKHVSFKKSSYKFNIKPFYLLPIVCCMLLYAI